MTQHEHKDILLNINIEKSNVALKIAELSIGENAIVSALNRIYYAVFYTVSAMAIKYDFITSKHAQMLGWFNKKFIHEEKTFDKSLNEIYRVAFDLRQENDYNDDVLPDIDKATELITDAKAFIEIVRKEINKINTEDKL